MHKKTVIVLLLAAILLSVLGPAAIADEENTVHISTVEDLKKLASDCRLDAYSVGLTVLLDNDIDLGGEPFAPIPSFSGVFKGNGHTISNFVCASNGSHMGFFRYVEEEGVITGLTVTGTVKPEDSRTDIGGLIGTNRGTISSCSFTGEVSGLINVGGIAGENYGKLIDCSFGGKVYGKRFTGGITGYSEGGISRCLNTAEVNTEIVTEPIDLEQLSLLDLTNLELIKADDTDVVSDTGGVAGMSIGVVYECKNTGTVGYQHYGYNVGGIVGRQSGYVNGCINYGSVLGRTDVGGVIGQMEPFLILTDRDTLADAIDDLTSSTNYALGRLSQNAAAAGGTMNTMESQAGTLAEDTNTMQQKKDNLDNVKVEDDKSFGEKVENAGNSVGGAVAGVDQGTKDNVVSGNVSAGDIENIAGAASGPAGDAKDSLDERVQAKKEATEKAENEYNQSTDKVNGDLNGMAGTLAQLNRQLSTGTVQLAGDLGSVNYNFNRVMTLISNALSGKSIMNIYEDVSEWDSPEEIQGKVNGCSNYATVNGDDNVGGIAGNMGVENKYDMTGVLDEVIGGEGIFTNTYAARCIIRNCSNEGIINGKKCNIGGVVGLCKMGSVFDSENYGNVSSTNGNYVGGVAGYSYTYIENSYSICNLTGVEYVGGIAGYGTRVIDCVSLIGLTTDGIACTGTVCGWADMTLREKVYDDKGEETDEPGEFYVRGNMFVDNGMGAVDGISYAGRAEPVEYTEILNKEGLPQTFSTLKLSFVADGTLVKEVVFDYGGDVDPAEIPEVPAKDGFSGYWEEFDYTGLTFSDTVEAVYVANLASLAVQDARNGSPLSILLLEGEFRDSASVEIEAYEGIMPTIGEKDKLLEAWTATIEDNEGGGNDYAARYLPPEQEKNWNTVIYVKNADGSWSKAVTEQNGSYYVFNASGSELTFAAVAVRDYSSLMLFAAAGGVLLLAILVIVVAALVRRHRKKANSVPAGNGEGGDAPAEDAPEAPAEDAPEAPAEETPQESGGPAAESADDDEEI